MRRVVIVAATVLLLAPITDPGAVPHAMPGDIVVKRGETVRFLVRNEGQVMHELK